MVGKSLRRDQGAGQVQVLIQLCLSCAVMVTYRQSLQCMVVKHICKVGKAKRRLQASVMQKAMACRLTAWCGFLLMQCAECGAP